jgi:hypothetical protein
MGKLEGGGGRHDPNNVCTCEQINNKIKFKKTTKGKRAMHMAEVV